MFIICGASEFAVVARGPAWRLMGRHLPAHVLPEFTPTKWCTTSAVRRVGAAMAAVTTVLVSPSVLRWSRNRMAFLAAVMFLLALCFATQRLVCTCQLRRAIQRGDAEARRNQLSTIFFALFAVTPWYAVWLHFASRDHAKTIGACTHRGAGPVAAGLWRWCSSHRW